MAVFIMLIWTLAAAASAQATVLPTTINENMTLTAAGSPYTGSSTIEAGATVKVEPGVKLTLGSLTVKGTLKAEGTALEPVVFTSGLKEPKPGNWKNIKFEPGSGASVLDHTEVRYGGTTNNTGGVEVVGSSPTITHSVIANNGSYGISVISGGSPEIAYNAVENNNKIGISFSSTGGEINIHDNLIEGNLAQGIYVNAFGSAFGRSLGRNTVVGNGGTGVYYSGPDIPPDIGSNSLSGNQPNQIAVTGTFAQSATWTDPGSLFSLGEVTVPSGITWTIKPGVDISPSKVIVKGTLKSEGTTESPVVFARGATPGSWKNIKFEPGSGASVLDHTEVRYGGLTSSTGGIEIVGSAPTITHSVIANNGGYGISVSSGGSPEIAYNEVKNNNSIGISFSSTGGEINIHDNLVEGNLSTGIYANAFGAAFGRSLAHNTVVGNGGTGISYSGPDIPGDITENTLEGNAVDDISVAGTVGHSSTWQLGGSPVRFNGTVVIPSGITLTLKPGVYIRSPRMTVNGTLHAEGTAARPIALTGPSQEKGGEWGGINFEAGSGASTLDYVEVAYGGSAGPMINIKGVSPSITNSTLRRSSGDAIRVQQSGQPTIERNRFRDNSFGLRYEGEGKLRAPNNDWGCANGPKPTGCGDEVSSNVEWRPAILLQELPRLCPGAAMLATSTTCLLQKYEPQLRYDSEENYYADSSAEITDNWGDEAALGGGSETGMYSNALVDNSEWPTSAPLAYSSPSFKGGSFPLTRFALGTTYPNEQLADDNDWLIESDEYVRDAHRLEAAGYLNAAYAHAYTDANGKRWLEYWYWYYYNPKDFAGVGKHEGDWETVIVGLDANNRPEEVIFSQHDGASNCYIGDVEKTEEGGPVVYVGLDSHAGYEKPGVFWATGEDDWADGAGLWAQPGLTIIGNSPPSWILWPGHWGNTQPEGGVPGQATSPQGPYFHEAWGAPDAYAANAFECTKTAEEEGGAPLQLNAVAGTSSPASIRGVSMVGQRPRVSYEVPKATGHGFWPRLRISVNELGDGGIPPVSKTTSNVKAQGRIMVPIELKAGHAAEVLGSIVYKNGRRVHLKPRMVRGW